MASVEMLMPQMGESVLEGTILAWLKKEGDTIEADESVLEVATDKVDTEVPATHTGVVQKLLVKVGDVVAIGTPIAIIETKGNENHIPEETIPSKDRYDDKEALLVSTPANTDTLISQPKNLIGEQAKDDRFYSPLVRSIAQKEGILPSELSKIPGTGIEGRVTKQDMLDYLRERPTPHIPSPSVPSISEPKTQVSISAHDEIIEMDRMRKMIAQRMLDSKRISPHVTSYMEADMTNIVLWRERHKEEYRKKHGEGITFTPFFIDAIARAIRDFPMINISVDGDKIIKKKDINIGMAVALPSGNLIVPVIKNADRLNLVGISKTVNDLAKRARNNGLKADDLSGGTYTLSNIGSFGNVMGTPILVQPQVAIMAVGAIVKKPAVIETHTGDVIAIRHKMFLSHTYDHRVVDGSLGGMFVKKVVEYLEAFDIHSTL